MEPTKETDVDRSCQWCDAEAAPDAKQCPVCGASLARRETIGDLVIPGVTHVDPALQQYAADPLRIPGPSRSQYLAGPAVGAAVVAGGPAALVGLGGLAAVAAIEYLGAGRGAGSTQPDPDKVGQPSEAVLQMVKRLEEEGQPSPPRSPDPTVQGSDADGTDLA